MNDQRLKKLLRISGEFELEVDKKTDNTIIDLIHNSPVSPSRISKILSLFIVRPVLIASIAILVLVFIFTRTGKVEKVDKEKLYNTIISQIQKINVDRNIDRALQLYSAD
ncbi:MAG: hypothetical protein KKH98_08530, partial [Spirochaetes bacterium]|nr:hypothetical protein [Spirochaetota bacterium]